MEVLYKSNDNFIISKVLDETVLVPISDTVANMSNMLILNDTGTFILNFVKQPTSVSAIAEAMAETYEISSMDQLCSDIQEFVDTLVSKGFFSIQE